MLKITTLPLITSILSASLLVVVSTTSAQERPFNTANNTPNYLLAKHHGDGHGMSKMDTNGDGEISKE